jgi:hypothetical protein
MDHRKIRFILQDALEEEIPPSEVQLWPAVKASLVAGKHPLQQGENMNTRPHRIPRLAFAILVTVALLLAVALVTPQGRTLAQSVLQFFMRAESTTFSLQPSQTTTGQGDSSAPTAEPPAPLVSVSEAEAQAGFDVAELPYVPDGFAYLGARLYGAAVHIEYETQDRGGHLIITQSQGGFVQSDWDRVPADAIVPVKIGERDGEFARGMFVVYAGETTARWNPDAPILRLRWVKDGVWFEMTKYGDAKAIAHLDQAGLIELAERLAIRP